LVANIRQSGKGDVPSQVERTMGGREEEGQKLVPKENPAEKEVWEVERVHGVTIPGKIEEI